MKLEAASFGLLCGLFLLCVADPSTSGQSGQEMTSFISKLNDILSKELANERGKDGFMAFGTRLGSLSRQLSGYAGLVGAFLPFLKTSSGDKAVADLTTIVLDQTWKIQSAIKRLRNDMPSAITSQLAAHDIASIKVKLIAIIDQFSLYNATISQYHLGKLRKACSDQDASSVLTHIEDHYVDRRSEVLSGLYTSANYDYRHVDRAMSYLENVITLASIARFICLGHNEDFVNEKNPAKKEEIARTESNTFLRKLSALSQAMGPYRRTALFEYIQSKRIYHDHIENYMRVYKQKARGEFVRGLQRELQTKFGYSGVRFSVIAFTDAYNDTISWKIYGWVGNEHDYWHGSLFKKRTEGRNLAVFWTSCPSSQCNQMCVDDLMRAKPLPVTKGVRSNGSPLPLYKDVVWDSKLAMFGDDDNPKPEGWPGDWGKFLTNQLNSVDIDNALFLRPSDFSEASSNLHVFNVTDNYKLFFIKKCSKTALTKAATFTQARTLRVGRDSKTSCGRRVIGYYTSWGENEMTTMQAQYLTHVIFAFAEVSADGMVGLGSADPAVLQRAIDRLDKLMAIKRSNPDLTTMIAVGGWENSQYFSGIAADETKTNNFIDSVLSFLALNDMDGLDVDWEYPVTGGATSGPPEDKQNFVLFLQRIRFAFMEKGYLLTVTGPAGDWVLISGFDLPQVLEQVDWINVMTYDYFGAWDSKFGVYTGPVAPLFNGAPLSYSGKLNAHYTSKYYFCKGNQNFDKIVFGLPFYGRYWLGVNNRSSNSNSDLWSMAQTVDGKVQGGEAAYRELVTDKWLLNDTFLQQWDDASRTPFLWSTANKVLLSYDNDRSIVEKVKYAIGRGMSGVMIWAIDLDDSDMTLLRVASDNICGDGSSDGGDYFCVDKRWWTADDDAAKAGQCGKSAPLYDGFYPVCDPDDAGYSCCSKSGYCGSGAEYCSCDGCVDYGANPSLINKEPTRPSRSPRQWFVAGDDGWTPGQPKCGPQGPRFPGTDQYAICNPDDDTANCCSEWGYCGTGDSFCNCPKCVDFKKNPDFNYNTSG